MVTEISPQYDFNPAPQKKVIFSIDGGGMRGIIPLAMMAELERQHQRPIHTMVDMIGGTSIGAVIAAGLGLGYSAEELLSVFKTELRHAFIPRNLRFWWNYLRRGFTHLYDIEPFINTLGQRARGRVISDMQKPIILMTAKDLRTSNTYFFVSKGPGLARFGQYPVTGAVAASGSAPVFFAPVMGNLVDGGTGVYGNPCLATSIEAMEYLGEAEGFTNGNVIHCSFGTGFITNDLPDQAGTTMNAFSWIPYLIYTGMNASALQQTFNTRAIYGDRMDFRRYNPYLQNASVREILGVDIHPHVDPAALSLDSNHPDQIDVMEAIGRAYATKINWQANGVLPWQTPGGHPAPRIEDTDWRNSLYD